MKNIYKLLLLWAVVALPIVVVGWFVGNIFNFGIYGPAIAFEIMIIFILFIYFSSDMVILHRYQAKKATERPNVTKIVEKMAKKAGVPTPRVYIAETLMPTLFTVGRGSNSSSIVMSDSLLNMSDEEELEVVVAHEMYHIVNEELLLNTVVSVISGSFTAFINSTSVFLGFFLATLVAPPASLLIRLTASQSRDNLADLKSIEMSGKPHKLISALNKINERLTSYDYKINPSHAHLFIINPLHDHEFKFFGRKLSSYNRLFNTHPPLADRLSMLEMAKENYREIEVSAT